MLHQLTTTVLHFYIKKTFGVTMSCNRKNCVRVAASVSLHRLFLHYVLMIDINGTFTSATEEVWHSFIVYHPSSNQIYSRYIKFFFNSFIYLFFMYFNLVIITQRSYEKNTLVCHTKEMSAEVCINLPTLKLSR